MWLTSLRADNHGCVVSRMAVVHVSSLEAERGGVTLSSSLHLESSALAVNDSRKRRMITCFANQMQDLFSYCCSFSIAHHLSMVENQLPQLREMGV
jgi:hypothetical protein